RPEFALCCGDKMGKEFDKYIYLSLEDGYKFTTCENFYDIWHRN
ncbi:unnamed protein product, partial [marine sediment metagenome]